MNKCGVIAIAKKNNGIDWGTIRIEYIGGGISTRKLAEKYGISYPALRDKASSEKWVEQRSNARSKGIALAEQKIADRISDNAVIAADIKRNLLLRLKRIEEQYPGDATEIRRKTAHGLEIYRIKDLTAAYKDITDDLPTGNSAEIEDLTPLVEMLADG